MSTPHIAIIHINSFPAEMFSDFRKKISAENLNFQIDSREESGPFGALEWLIPTAVIVYLGKSYFDSFLKEMGKDHYNLLKAGLKGLHDKVLGPSAPKVTLVSTAGKTSKDQPYSLVYSILAESDAGFTFKLLIQTEATEQEYEEILDAFLAFLVSFHAHSLESEAKEQLREARIVSRTLLLAFNKETKAIEPIDPIQKNLPPRSEA